MSLACHTKPTKAVYFQGSFTAIAQEMVKFLKFNQQEWFCLFEADLTISRHKTNPFVSNNNQGLLDYCLDKVPAPTSGGFTAFMRKVNFSNTW